MSHPPTAKKVPHPVYFGVNPKDPKENRGENPMDPPIVLNDDYYWLRDDDRKDTEVLNYVQEENEYFVNQMKDTEELQKSLYREILSHLKETDIELPYQRKRGGYWYYTRTVQGLSYKLHCRRPAQEASTVVPKIDPEGGSDDSEEQVYLDENELAAAEKARNAAAKAKAKASAAADGTEKEDEESTAEAGGEEEEVRGGTGTYTDVGSCVPCRSERMLAYSVDHSGSEQYTIRFKNIDGSASASNSAVAATGQGEGEGDEVEVDVLRNTCGSVVWSSDDRSVFYLLLDDEHRPYKLFQHVLGTTQSQDRCLYTEEDALFWLGLDESTSGDYVFCVSESKETVEVYSLHVAATASADNAPVLTSIRPRQKGVRYSVDHHRGAAGAGDEDCFFIVTNIDGCKEGKLVLSKCAATDSADKSIAGAWVDVLPYAPTRHIEEVQCFQNNVVLVGREAGLTAMWVADTSKVLAAMQMRGTGSAMESLWRKLSLDEESYSCGPGCNMVYETDALRVHYSSLVTPAQTLQYNMAEAETGATADAGRCHYTVLKQKEVPLYDASLYHTERVFAPSRDGQTQIPITMVYRKEVSPPADVAGGAATGISPWLPGATTVRQPRPMLLTGYGSYGAASDPYFDYKRLALLDRGITVAIAHIRGGNEMGRYWYEEQGKYLTKRNTFLDFVDAAKFLTEGDGSSGGGGPYTSRDQLATVGRSAGGLLMGAVVTMAPDQFRVAVADVPFVDSLITMADPTIPLTVVEWEEWGNPNEAKFHDYMKSYAPYQNIQEGVRYPALLVTTGLNDPRVAYWEGAKFVARMRACYAASAAQAVTEAEAAAKTNTLLLKTDMSTGHFSASDRYKFIKEMAAEYAFILKHLGMLR